MKIGWAFDSYTEHLSIKQQTPGSNVKRKYLKLAKTSRKMVVNQKQYAITAVMYTELLIVNFLPILSPPIWSGKLSCFDESVPLKHGKSVELYLIDYYARATGYSNPVTICMNSWPLCIQSQNILYQFWFIISCCAINFSLNKCSQKSYFKSFYIRYKQCRFYIECKQ